MSKILQNLIYILLLSLLLNTINSAVLVKAGKNINFSCDRNIYYIVIDVVFSQKPTKEYYPFTLYLESPEELNFKCMLDYAKRKIYCFRAFSYEEDYLEEETLFQFPYPFPYLEDIEWDYETFLEKVYRRAWYSKAECGTENIFNVTDINYKKWNLEGNITNLIEGQCKVASITKEEVHKYYFDMLVSFTDGDIVQLLRNKKNTDQIELMQDIWVPLLPPEEEKSKTKKWEEEDEFPFAYCNTNEKINNKNVGKLKLNCYIPIWLDEIFNGVIRIGSFFDKLYVRQGTQVNIITTYIKIIEGNLTLSLGEKDHGIICPNQPVFTIESKDDISMGMYYNETNKYTFFLTGTLSNGYYAFKNGTTVELNETYQDITFNLVVQDNFMDTEENDVNVSCILPSRSPYNLKDMATIKCIGAKEDKSNQNNNVDIVLNWNLKTNNNFNDIIISWPRTFDDINRKNIYSYELIGLSIRQSNFGCHNNNFDFYVYIYDLGREPKLSFELPLSSPKNTMGDCQIFDSTALKCSINLKHKKISKGTHIMLPEKGSENEIETNEGNIIIFTMNNFSQINNDRDYYIKTEEQCGDYLVVGTLKDMGMSHGTSVTVYIIIIVLICLIIVGFIAYIALKLRLKYKRGRKLTTSEESKDNSSSNNTSAKV